jgi:hypothetical protein
VLRDGDFTLFGKAICEMLAVCIHASVGLVELCFED